jgi:hypothetical protein
LAALRAAGRFLPAKIKIRTNRRLSEPNHPTEENPLPTAAPVVEKLGSAPERFWAWVERRPLLAIILVSLLAVTVNCYPVIFCGKSFTSYYAPTHGSDAAAMMIAEVPMAFVASRALLEHGELPLWNRYNHCGETFIGQAIYMLGDPLQLIVFLGHGAALAWDIKFLTAKFLFCVGFGWLVLTLLRSAVLGFIFAALAAYCGAFFYIFCHPAFFVFCYSPWILLAALKWLGDETKENPLWGLVWLLANVACFSAGHVEAALILIGGLNAAALAQALMQRRTLRARFAVTAQLAVGTLLFLGFTAPVWMAFLVEMAGAYSSHMEAMVLQIPLRLLPGMFDAACYLLCNPGYKKAAIAPGGSLLLLVGCVFSVRHWRQLRAETFFWINSAAIVVWVSGAFKILPPAILADIPLLNHVGHTHTDFSYLLVLHLTLQAAYGFKAFAAEKNPARAGGDLLWAAFMMAGMLWSYFLCETVPAKYFLAAAAGAIGAPAVFSYFNARSRVIPLAGLLGIAVLGFVPLHRFAFYNSGDANLLLLPGPRPALDAPSAAVEKIRAANADPFRVYGRGLILAGNQTATYRLEDISSCSPLSNLELINLISNFPGVEITSYWVINVFNPMQAQPLLNLLNVKYLLSPPGTVLSGNLDYRTVYHEDYDVIENLDVWPRAFFADKILSDNSRAAFIQYLITHGKSPFVALPLQAFYENPALVALGSTSPPAITPAKNYVLRPNATAFDIHAPSAGVVCLTETQAKDFTATVNGREQPVLTANRAFKAVYLAQAGDYHIEFTYRPRFWRASCAAFWISLAGTGALALAGFLRRQKPAGKISPA